MSLTHQQAVDEMSTMFKDVWDGTGWQVDWDDVRSQRDTADQPWAMFVIRHAPAGQTTLGGVGKRTFNRLGIIITSIFTPIGNGLSTSYALAKIAADAYEGKHSPNGVWFRNVAIQEIGRDGEFFQLNVTIAFDYDEIK